MAAKRKISIRKILQTLLTLSVTSCCVVAIVSASNIEDEKVLKSVAIHYNNCKKYHSVEEQEIMDLAITNRNIDILHTPASRLDIHAMEKTIKSNPWIANAQVFIDNERILHMYVTQRIPVVRVFQQNGVSYYMDTTMSIIPLSSNYIYYSTVVTNVPELKNDSMGWALRKDIISMVRTIHADSFWSAQISHIIVDSAGMYELTPILGDHRILFGDANGVKEKLGNLFAFYKNVLNRIGWDKYQVLDVRFNGQVVASPSLPYSGPVDKAATNMNWVNSIVETEAKNDAKDSLKTKDIKVAQVTQNKKSAPVTQPVKATEKKPATTAQNKKNLPVKPPAKADLKKGTPAVDKNKALVKQTGKPPVKPPPKQAPPDKQVTAAAKKKTQKAPGKEVKVVPKKTTGNKETQKKPQ